MVTLPFPVPTSTAARLLAKEVPAVTVTIYRHAEYNKFIVTVDRGFTTAQYTLYDVTVSELGEFVRSLTAEA